MQFVPASSYPVDPKVYNRKC